MITRTEAERLALALNDLRPEWPYASLVTFITSELSTWPLLDAAVGLVYVASDRKHDGTWASRTPARVKEQGPWRTVGLVDADAQAAREKAARELEQRQREAGAFWTAITDCGLCNDEGRLPSGFVCTHDQECADRAARGAAAARAAIRPLASIGRPQTPAEPTGDQA